MEKLAYLNLLFCLFFFQSCLDREIPEIGYNIFDDPDEQLITITFASEVELLPGITGIRIEWESVYYDLPDAQKNQIAGFRILRDGIQVQTLAKTETSYKRAEFSNNTVCYAVAFYVPHADGNLIGNSKEECITVE